MGSGNCTVARERTGKDGTMREEKGPESSVMRTVIRSDRNRKERTVERTVSYGVREKWRRRFQSTGSTMVSKANRYESIETENHRHESKKHAEKSEKIRVSTKGAKAVKQSELERENFVRRELRARGS